MATDYTKSFETHGFDLIGESGDNVYGECPFCENPKFYLNREKGLWDCKHGNCMRKGNLFSFIVQLHEYWLEQTTLADYRRLSKDRQLRVSTLKRYGLAWNGRTGQWMLPIYNEQNAMVQLRHFYLGKPLYNTPGMKSALFGAQEFSKRTSAKRGVWICEGEWDAMALSQTLKRVSVRDIIVAVPGANIWKPQWTPLMANRAVIIAYDADRAGVTGAERVTSELQQSRVQVSMVEWPEEVPSGFDIRDFMSLGGRYVDLMELVRLQPYTRPGSLVDPLAKQGDHFTPENSSSAFLERTGMIGETVTWAETLRGYQKWLHMSADNEKALRIIFAITLSNRIQGDPIWLFLVAPPGGCKTELLLSLHKIDETIIKSTLTAHSLVSGYRMPNDLDPSLIPQLHGRVFILKDFTEVLQMPRSDRDEVYSILRGAYDGTVEKTFGNGITRQYECHFSMIAGVTHHIQADRTASLGERFLLFKMEGDAPETAIYAAMKNSGHENTMREELAEIALKFISHEIPIDNLPEVPDPMLEQLVNLAQFVAHLRGEVSKGYRENILYRPHPEIGTRLAKQLKKLAVCLQLLDGGKEVSKDNYELVERVALDTCRGFELDIFKAVGRSGNKGAVLTEISDKTGIPRTTVREKLEDLVLMGIFWKKKTRQKGPGRPESRYILSSSADFLWRNIKAVRDDERNR